MWLEKAQWVKAPAAKTDKLILSRTNKRSNSHKLSLTYLLLTYTCAHVRVHTYTQRDRQRQTDREVFWG